MLHRGKKQKQLKLNTAGSDQSVWYIYRQVWHTIKKHFVLKWGKYGCGDIGWHASESNDWL